MRSIVFNSWIGLGMAVAAIATLSAVLLPAGLPIKALGLLLALVAVAVSVALQVRNGRQSTWQVIQDVDHEAVPVARPLSGTSCSSHGD